MRFAYCLVLAGCSHDPVADFVGTWSYDNSTVSTTCNTMAADTKPLVGNFTLARSGDNTIAIDSASQYTLALAASGDCTPRFDVGDGRADLVPQADCILATATNTTITLSYTQYTLELANVNGPDLAPMTPGLVVTLAAHLSSTNGNCDVSANPTAIAVH